MTVRASARAAGPRSGAASSARTGHARMADARAGQRAPRRDVAAAAARRRGALSGPGARAFSPRVPMSDPGARAFSPRVPMSECAPARAPGQCSQPPRRPARPHVGPQPAFTTAAASPTRLAGPRSGAASSARTGHARMADARAGQPAPRRDVAAAAARRRSALSHPGARAFSPRVPMSDPGARAFSPRAAPRDPTGAARRRTSVIRAGGAAAWPR